MARMSPWRLRCSVGPVGGLDQHIRLAAAAWLGGLGGRRQSGQQPAGWLGPPRPGDWPARATEWPVGRVMAEYFTSQSFQSGQSGQSGQ